MLDYHAIKRDVKAELLVRWQQVALRDDAASWVWIAHAFGVEGTKNNPLLTRAVEEGRLWLEEDGTWRNEGQIASIAILCQLLGEVGESCRAEYTGRITAFIQQQRQKGLSKFSRLNDPYYVYGLAIATTDYLPDDDLKWLRQHCNSNIQTTNLRRGLLFAAAAAEVGSNVTPLMVTASQIPIHDILV